MRRNLQARRVTGGAEMIARILLGETVAETGPRGCHGQAPLAHVRS
jgi:hypothetical protein